MMKVMSKVTGKDWGDIKRTLMSVAKPKLANVATSEVVNGVLSSRFKAMDLVVIMARKALCYNLA